jgi:hypothetical protein
MPPTTMRLQVAVLFTALCSVCVVVNGLSKSSRPYPVSRNYHAVIPGDALTANNHGAILNPASGGMAWTDGMDSCGPDRSGCLYDGLVTFARSAATTKSVVMEWIVDTRLLRTCSAATCVALINAWGELAILRARLLKIWPGC